MRGNAGLILCIEKVWSRNWVVRHVDVVTIFLDRVIAVVCTCLSWNTIQDGAIKLVNKLVERAQNRTLYALRGSDVTEGGNTKAIASSTD